MTSDPKVSGTPPIIQAAYDLLERSILTYRGQPVGTVAALAPDLPADNYRECFVRDFMPAAYVFLADGRYEIVRNFLSTTLEVRSKAPQLTGHYKTPGVLPASFHVVRNAAGEEELQSDFGDRAIGRVAPVDSMMWWVGLLARYVEVSGDLDFARRTQIQEGLRGILDLVMQDAFEIYPTLLTPDGCFMIDRRLGVYGHPLEVQALFYGLLKAMRYLLSPCQENCQALDLVRDRGVVLRNFVRRHYWLDFQRLNEIHRYKTEQFGAEVSNVLNIYPEIIPDWVADWLPDEGGYLAGNIGPGRLDFRFFALGNLVAIITGLASEEMAHRVFALYEARWNDLIGQMPLKICFPALEGLEWQMMTGSDPKNTPWSYHNAGHWPALLHYFTSAALRVGRQDLAQRAFDLTAARLMTDGWPEYYDGRHGRLIGRRASLNQIWSATSLIAAFRLLEKPERVSKIYLPSIEAEL